MSTSVATTAVISDAVVADVKGDARTFVAALTAKLDLRPRIAVSLHLDDGGATTCVLLLRGLSPAEVSQIEALIASFARMHGRGDQWGKGKWSPARHVAELLLDAELAIDTYDLAHRNACAEVGSEQKHARQILPRERSRAVAALAALAAELALEGHLDDVFLPLGEIADAIQEGYAEEGWSLRVHEIVTTSIQKPQEDVPKE